MNKYGKVMLLIAAIIIMILIVFVVFDAYLTRQAWIAECKAQKGMGCGRECVQFCIKNMPTEGDNYNSAKCVISCYFFDTIGHNTYCYNRC